MYNSNNKMWCFRVDFERTNNPDIKDDTHGIPKEISRQNNKINSLENMSVSIRASWGEKKSKNIPQYS